MSLFRILEALALVALATLRLLIVTAGACLLAFGRPMWRHLLSG